ncbi:MAG TPA: hypothetical protein VNZ03_36150 [Terriglobales bacterium]|nr:hypothetical protein [Terriglobales bacterium]
MILVSGTAALVGCGVPGVPKPPSLELAQPVADLRAVRKGDRVFLDWTVPTETTDRLAVRQLGRTRICRSLNAPVSDCANPVAEVPMPRLTRGSRQQKPAKRATKVQANYIDNLPRILLVDNPRAQIFYAISVLNENGRSAGISNIVHVPAVPALPPPSDFRAEVTADGVVVSWTAVPHLPETSTLRHAYQVYRRPEGETADTAVGEVPLDASSATKLVDHSFEWEKTYSYRATVVTLIHEEGEFETQFEGDDTPAVKLFAHDIFPPAVPSGLQAVFSGPGQPPFIDLIWAPDSDADLAGYNVFRHEAGTESVKINAELGKTPGFRDTNVASGKTYFYSVSAVDVRGNESVRSQEASEAVP